MAFAGCGQDAAPGPKFIAYAKDFQGFESWPSETFDDPVPGGATHVAGVRTVYLNRAPDAGATEFPLGTIIVKQTSDGKMFAQVKRGGGYNLDGAKNWEWFEIGKNANGSVFIQWQGTFPPVGEAYGGDPNGCNGCHLTMNAVANDYVIAQGLSLKNGLAFDVGIKPDASGDAAADGPGDAGTKTDASVDGDVVDANSNMDAGTDTETGASDAQHE
ncbi:MAG TPA: hypothetical protein VH560_01105 [Polyangia bacterium]|nr:hypothetical protein [Polyangia bacterium]